MIKGARSSAVVALLVIVAGLAVAACGSSNSSSASASASSSGAATSTTGTSTSGTSTAPGRAGGFASLTATQRSCLKAKGVTLPTGGGHFGGGRFGGGTGTGTFTRPTGTPPGGTSTNGGGFGPGGAPGGYGGGGFRGRGGANASKFAAAFKACGVSFGGGFGARAGGAAGHVSATALKTFVACVNQHGYKLTDVNTSGKGAALPKSLETNKKFLAAAKDCEQDLRPSAPAGTTTTSSS